VNPHTDIGFVAYEPTRLGAVEFSQSYMPVRQSFLVLDGSPIKTIADIDRAGHKIAGTINDSITLCMKRISGQIAGADRGRNRRAQLGANRERLITLSTATPGTRLFPDDLSNVPQNIVVPKDRPAALAAVSVRLSTGRTCRVSCRARSSAAEPSGLRSRRQA